MAEHRQVSEGKQSLKKPRLDRRESLEIAGKQGGVADVADLQQRVGNHAIQQLLIDHPEIMERTRKGAHADIAQCLHSLKEPVVRSSQHIPTGERGNTLIGEDYNPEPSQGFFPHPVNTLQIMRQALLNATEEKSAIDYSDRHYDSRSVRIIQIITGTNVDGVFGKDTAQAVATFQQNHPPLAVDGKVGENTLNTMIPVSVAAGLHEHAIQLVADFYNLNTTRDTLSVHYDAGLVTPFNTTFQSGNLRVIQIGTIALANATALRDAIQGGLNVPAPAVAAPGARPTFLSPAEEQKATIYNRSHFTDRRSVLGIQGVVGTRFDAGFGPDTAERIAEFQDSHGIQVDGMVGEETLREMVTVLNVTGQQDPAIRMIMDFYHLSDPGLLDISYDATLALDNASTSGVIPGPSTVRVGPAGFAQGFEGLVHSIAHELEHVRQRREGIQRRPIREFLAEAIEIMSVAMPEENADGFMDDARRALSFWRLMTPAEQTDNGARFNEVRFMVQNRFNGFTPAEQATHQVTRDAYNAVVVPP